MLSLRQLPLVTAGLSSAGRMVSMVSMVSSPFTRTFSTSFFSLQKNPEEVNQDVQSQLRFKFDKKTQDEVVKFLEDNELNALAKTVKELELDGSLFHANIQDLSQLSDGHKKEGENLSSILKVQWTKPNPTPVVKTFSRNGTVYNKGKHFYIRRVPTGGLLQQIREDPGFYLFHGPRRSGKSTLAHQMIEGLDPSRYVFAKVAIPNGGLIAADAIWSNLARKLSSDEFSASPEVCEAAKKYLDPSVARSSAFLDHLFRHDYGEKKLILFWDEFDNAYAKEYRAVVAGALRTLRDDSMGLHFFGGVVCLGAFNATIVGDGNMSVFTPGKTYTHDEILDFSLEETKFLFRLYKREFSKAEVSDEVVQSIQRETGGHAGLVNLCGAFIQEELNGKCNLTQWQSSKAEVIDFIASQTTFQVVMASLKDDPQVGSLLRSLCEDDVKTDPNSDPQKRAQQYGLAKIKNRGTKHYIAIKSELIRDVVRRYVTRDYPAFTEMPLLPKENSQDPDRVDIPALLSSLVKAFHAEDLHKTSLSKMKWHDVYKGLLAPKEEVYQKETYRVLDRTLRDDSWSVEDNVMPAGDKGSVADDEDAMDFLLSRNEKKHGRLRVGLELCASLTPARIVTLAKRPYPEEQDLDQYAVVHFTNRLQKNPIDSYEVKTEEGEIVRTVPIFHVVHNDDFTQITVHTKMTGTKTDDA